MSSVRATPPQLQTSVLLLNSSSQFFCSFFPPSHVSLSSFSSLPSLSLTCSSSLKHHSLSSISHLTPSHNDDDDDEYEEEQVIGDCLVFEDGIFDDPFLQPDPNPPQFSPIPHKKPINKKKQSTSPEASKPEIETESLIPEEWKQVVDEINLSKKERRKLAQASQFGQRILKKTKLPRVNLDEYLRYKDEKLAQLKPLVLDNPPGFSPIKGVDDDGDGDGDGSENGGGPTRVEPRNPRWSVYGRGLDDVTDFFNSGDYQPGDDNNKSQGRQKMFTREEKALMNARIPKLATATSQKWLPLHTLAASGEFYLANNLLKYDVDINAADQDGLTALHKAVTCKKQAVTNYLLRESADPFVRDKDGATVMHYAVRTVSSQAIKTLLLHDVDINLQDNDGWTPLHLAVQARRTDVVRLLLMKGADKTLKNQDGLTPLELCLHSGRDTKTYELIKLLKQLPRQRC